MSRHLIVGCATAVAAALAGQPEAAAQKSGRKGPEPASLAEVKSASHAAYAPDGSYLLVDYTTTPDRNGRGTTSLATFDPKTGERKVSMEKPPGECDRIAVSPDGKRVAAIATGPRQLKVWDAATGKIAEEHTLPEWKGSIVHAQFLTFAADGQYLYSVWNRYKVLEVKLGGSFRLAGEKLDIYSPYEVAIDPQARRLITAENRVGARLSFLRVHDLAKEGEPQEVRLDAHVFSVALSGDGKTLAISFHGPPGGGTRLELWDVPAMQRRTTLPADPRKGVLGYRSMAFAPDDKTLAGGPQFEKPRPGGVVLNSVGEDGKVGWELKHQSFVTEMTFSPDGKTIAAVMYDHSLVLVDAATGELKKP